MSASANGHDWQVHGERIVYDSEWVRVSLADVELPDGTRLDHHVVRAPWPAAGAVVHDVDRGILLLRRHRFITDTWGWEIPAGKVDPGEAPVDGAARETLEETGWLPGPLRPLVTFFPSNGLSDQTFHVFVADTATLVGNPTDRNEAAEVAWQPVELIRTWLTDGTISDGMTLTALGVHLANGARPPTADVVSSSSPRAGGGGRSAP